MTEELSTVRIGLVFELRFAKTRQGESVQVVGNWPELGEWKEHDESSNCQLRTFTCEGSPFPKWSMRLPIWIDTSSTEKEIVIEYKFVRDQRELSGNSDGFVWEDDIDNRRVSLPLTDGSIWIISDGRWDSKSDDPIITSARLSEVLSRLSNLDPDWYLQKEETSAEAFVLTPRDEEEVDKRKRPVKKERPVSMPRRHYAIEDEFRALSPPRSIRENVRALSASGSTRISSGQICNRRPIRQTTWSVTPMDAPMRLEIFMSDDDEDEDQEGPQQTMLTSATVPALLAVQEENDALRDEIKMLHERLSKLKNAPSAEGPQKDRTHQAWKPLNLPSSTSPEAPISTQALDSTSSKNKSICPIENTPISVLRNQEIRPGGHSSEVRRMLARGRSEDHLFPANLTIPASRNTRHTLNGELSKSTIRQRPTLQATADFKADFKARMSWNSAALDTPKTPKTLETPKTQKSKAKVPPLRIQDCKQIMCQASSSVKSGQNLEEPQAEPPSEPQAEPPAGPLQA